MKCPRPLPARVHCASPRSSQLQLVGDVPCRGREERKGWQSSGAQKAHWAKQQATAWGSQATCRFAQCGARATRGRAECLGGASGGVTWAICPASGGVSFPAVGRRCAGYKTECLWTQDRSLLSHAAGVTASIVDQAPRLPPKESGEQHAGRGSVIAAIILAPSLCAHRYRHRMDGSGIRQCVSLMFAQRDWRGQPFPAPLVFRPHGPRPAASLSPSTHNRRIYASSCDGNGDGA